MVGKLQVGNTSFTINFEDNQTVAKLQQLFPLTITMNELNGNEKYYYLSTTLPTNSSRVSFINAGDVMLYGNNCLVVFYESFSSGYSYTKLGHIENPKNLKSALGGGNVKVSWSV